jgi:hypothetical protein
VQFTREKIPDADLCVVKKEVDSIRASFRKELRRVRDSKRNGSSADDVYKPTPTFPSFLYSFFSQTHRIHLVLSPLLQLASVNSFWILKCTSKFGVRSCVCGEIYPSRTRERDLYVYGALNTSLDQPAVIESRRYNNYISSVLQESNHGGMIITSVVDEMLLIHFISTESWMYKHIV